MLIVPISGLLRIVCVLCALCGLSLCWQQPTQAAEILVAELVAFAQYPVVLEDVAHQAEALGDEQRCVQRAQRDHQHELAEQRARQPLHARRSTRAASR
mgnify:CR=1 FL=1